MTEYKHSKREESKFLSIALNLQQLNKIRSRKTTSLKLRNYFKKALSLDKKMSISGVVKTAYFKTKLYY